MLALADIAARAVGATSCVEILKVPEGNFNKTFVLTLNDGQEVIAKLPNPNAGRPHYTTARRSVEDYAIAAARRELVCISQLREFPKPQGLFYGPQQYRPTPESKLLVLNNYLKVAKHLLPTDEVFRASVLWHSDLHPNNIFVNPADPTQIIGIIDWQSVHLSPFYLQARNPALIDFDGPIPEGLNPIELPPNFDLMSSDEQHKAKLLRSAQSLYKLYEVDTRRRNKNVFRALQYRETLPCKITALAGSLFNDGEPIVEGMLMAVERDWTKVVGVGPDGQPTVPCPLAFSKRDKELQAVHEAQWTQGVELMETVLQGLGAYRGWDGWVNHADYDVMKARLKECLAQLLDHEAMTGKERAAWIAAWPFTDQSAGSGVRRYKPPQLHTARVQATAAAR
ncbi:MAG: hypothetical protein LQ341_001131 [Variospora aurantia]|nr:MAG: hypothetical protein LQ341_001131 [Variospora aurantia]